MQDNDIRRICRKIFKLKVDQEKINKYYSYNVDIRLKDVPNIEGSGIVEKDLILKWKQHKKFSVRCGYNYYFIDLKNVKLSKNKKVIVNCLRNRDNECLGFIIISASIC